MPGLAVPAGARARVSCSAARWHKWVRCGTIQHQLQGCQAKTVVNSGRRTAKDGVRVPGAWGLGSVTRVRMDWAIMKI